MADKVHGFFAPEVARIARAVRLVERMPGDGGGGDDHGHDGPNIQLVKVTKAATTGRGKVTGIFAAIPQQEVKFYNLSETKNGRPLIKVDEWVWITTINKEYLDEQLAAKAADGDNWAAAVKQSASFPWKITGAGSLDSSDRRIYTGVEVTKTSAGYGGWGTMTGGRSGNCYNYWEDSNIAAGIHGSGWNKANLQAGFTEQAVQTNLITRAWEETFLVTGQTVATTEIWFHGNQWVDGECP